MKKVMLCIILLNSICLIAQGIRNFLSQPAPITLRQFLDLVQLHGDDRDQFLIYYKATINDIKSMRLLKKNEKRKRLEEQGMNSLEIKHPEWAREISFLLKLDDHPSHQNVHTFLVRYALLESYYEKKTFERHTTWVKIRGFFNETKKTLAGWFTPLRVHQKLV